mmetsp:Transcript_5155/g.10874  ORF Transcript_5155/g.10874 Transcript_5155/m.10874 type:complete len:241 (+) Transcript_5155:58-780(+)
MATSQRGQLQPVQRWSVMLPSYGLCRVEYDGGLYLTVNEMQLKVRFLSPSTSFSSLRCQPCFANFGGSRFDAIPKRKASLLPSSPSKANGFQLKVDGKLVEEVKYTPDGQRDFRGMSEGTYMIGTAAPPQQRKEKENRFVLEDEKEEGEEGDSEGGIEGWEEKEEKEEEKHETATTTSSANNDRRIIGHLPRGVEHDPGSGLFRAGITIKGRYMSLGSFETVEEASESYEEASRKYKKAR